MMNHQSETLIFVHGMCHGSWCWEEYFVPYFEILGYKCIAINLPGHDQPGKNHSIHQYGLEDYVQALSDVVDQCEHEPILIGHSMGGMVVQRYIKKGRCKKMILMSSVPPSGSLKPSLNVFKSNPSSIKYLLRGDFLSIAQKYPALMFSPELDSSDLNKYIQQLCSESIKAYLQMLLPISTSPRQTKIPTLVIGGEKDLLFDPQIFKNIAKRYQAELTIIRNGSHDLMLENDWRLSADAIHQWLVA